MFKTIKYLFILLTLSCCYSTSLAQQAKVDSLQNVLKTAKEDTSKVNTLNVLAWELKNNNPDTSIILSTQALLLAQKNKYPKGIVQCYHNLGVFNYFKGNYALSLDYDFKALKIRESFNDKKGIFRTLGNIGIIYYEQGDYPKALDFYFKALKMAEELGNKNGVATALLNIGLVYFHQNDYPKALNYYFKTLKMAEVLGDKNKIAIDYGNIGHIYMNQRDYPQASDYFFKALKIDEELGDKNGIADALGGIGLVYNEQGEAHHDPFKKEELFNKAFGYYFKALKINEELGDKNGISRHLANIGSLFTTTKRYKEAEKYLQKALMLSTEINALNIVKDIQQDLSELYTQTHQPAKAFEHYKKYIASKDSLFNEENTKKTVRSEMNFEFDKKQTEEKAEQDKKDVIAAQELKQQRLQRNYFIIGFALVLLLALFIFRSYRQKQKANEIITLQKAEVEEQKKVVEEKNKDILDSIHYAKRIQDALLKKEEHISKHLPEYFILFLPKDIVSGDFYWATEKHGHWYVAAVDCTGHGVPGAFMSMLGMSFLNDIVSVEQLLTPAEILNQLRDKVVNELRQTGEAGGSKDGMDISLIRLNLQTNELQWAGANNALNLVRSGELQEIKADKQPIGYHPEPKLFTNHTIQINKGDCIYIFSDGYADQFGGPNGKKFKYKQLEDLILANNKLPLEQQKQILKKAFVEWRGKLEQIDDVCVIGVRV
jgi:serine phosphatase RsbU (regulator of sigma subunit)